VRANQPVAQLRGKKPLLGLVAWLSVSFLAAAIGAAASIDAGVFYSGLARPRWAPPAWLFGPVWTLLYAMMGIAVWMVWRERGLAAARTAFALFFAQLAANALWSWLFFGLHRGAMAFADILLLWILIAATILSFWRIRRLAAALLVPYLLWASYAAVLNFWVWQHNPQSLG
jgi:tryptophan-rich sensory protein